MEPGQLRAFRERVWLFYQKHGRHDLPWRLDMTPYGTVVSEVMLQQTQVSRVLERWPRWLRRFDSFEALAAASVAEVLGEWQGLGYNRRAVWLRDAAVMVLGEFGGSLPSEQTQLVRLPGIGPNTAGSVAAFAYNKPAVFIETNIRRVFLHEFFSGQEGVADVQLGPLIEATLDQECPREWYWALMDYGADLAKREPNANRRSKHYSVQSRFEGSLRQVRGAILRQLLEGTKTRDELSRTVMDERLGAALGALVREGLVVVADDEYRIAT